MSSWMLIWYLDPLKISFDFDFDFLFLNLSECQRMIFISFKFERISKFKWKSFFEKRYLHLKTNKKLVQVSFKKNNIWYI